MVLSRPGMVSKMGLSVNCSATPDFFPLCISPLPEGLKGLDDLNDSIYNLSGQRLAKAQKGVNIIGGKKIVMR